MEQFEKTVNGWKKEELRPGMPVRNWVSGKFGELAEKPGEDGFLAICADNAVMVDIVVKSKSRRGRKRKAIWALGNVVVL